MHCSRDLHRELKARFEDEEIGHTVGTNRRRLAKPRRFFNSKKKEIHSELTEMFASGTHVGESSRAMKKGKPLRFLHKSGQEINKTELHYELKEVLAADVDGSIAVDQWKSEKPRLFGTRKSKTNDLTKQVSALSMSDPLDLQCHRRKGSRREEDYESPSSASVASDPTANFAKGLNAEKFESSISEFASHNLSISDFSKESLNLPESLSSFVRSAPSAAFFSRWESSCSIGDTALEPTYSSSFDLPDCHVTSNQAPAFTDDVMALETEKIGLSDSMYHDASQLNSSCSSFNTPIKVGSQAPIMSPRKMPSLDSLFPDASEVDAKPPTSPLRTKSNNSMPHVDLGVARAVG